MDHTVYFPYENVQCLHQRLPAISTDDFIISSNNKKTFASQKKVTNRTTTNYPTIPTKATNRYLLIGEYYSKNPESLSYRGYDDKLYTRDFAGEMMNKFEDLKLIDYRFHYHKDPNFPQDDITWFLLQKIN